MVLSYYSCILRHGKHVAAEGHPAAELHLQSELPGDLPGIALSSLMLLTFHYNRMQQLPQRLEPDMNTLDNAHRNPEAPLNVQTIKFRFRICRVIHCH